MKKIDHSAAAKSEADILTRVGDDLAAARREGRFKDALLDIEEILIGYKNTTYDSVKTQCVALLAARGPSQKSG